MEAPRTMPFHKLFHIANPFQQERLLDLVGALRELRNEIVEDHDVLAGAPQLASPRSSLNPRLVQGESDE